MRLAIVGNMANNGYNTAKALRAAGHDVDLYVTSAALNAVSSVEWEEGVLGPGTAIDATNFGTFSDVNGWKRPSWVFYENMQLISKGRISFDALRKASTFYNTLNEYDMVELHVPYPIVAPFLKVPCTVYEAGWIRYFPRGRTFHDYLAARGYAKANRILVTNVDMWRIFGALPYIKPQNVQYMPFAVDTEKYKPSGARELRRTVAADNEVLILQPTRQHWIEKGNNKVFQAFAQLCKMYDKLKLWVASWGSDAEKSRALVSQLGIADKVIWFTPVSKPMLIQYINASDIILDQFPEPSDADQIWGPWGTAALEAMACGKPLLMYYDVEGVDRYVGNRPPALRCLSTEEIAGYLRLLIDDPSLRQRTGDLCRDWVIQNHGHATIADRYRALIESIA